MFNENALTDEDLMISTPQDETTIKQKEVKNNFLTETEMLELELFFQKQRYLKFRMEDLKKQIQQKQTKINENIDETYHLKNDLIFLEKGIKKLISELSDENKNKNKLIIEIAKKYNLPDDYKNGKVWKYNDISGEIIL